MGWDRVTQNSSRSPGKFWSWDDPLEFDDLGPGAGLLYSSRTSHWIGLAQERDTSLDKEAVFSRGSFQTGVTAKDCLLAALLAPGVWVLHSWRGIWAAQQSVHHTSWITSRAGHVHWLCIKLFRAEAHSQPWHMKSWSRCCFLLLPLCLPDILAFFAYLEDQPMMCFVFWAFVYEEISTWRLQIVLTDTGSVICVVPSKIFGGS